GWGMRQTLRCCYLLAGIAMVNFFLLRTTTTVVLVLLFTSPEAERVTIDSPFTDSITSPGRSPAANATLLGCTYTMSKPPVAPKRVATFGLMAMASIPGTNIGGGGRAGVRASNM